MSRAAWWYRFWVVWSAFWFAFGAGCITQGKGNATVHLTCMVLQVPLLAVNVYLLHRQKAKEIESE